MISYGRDNPGTLFAHMTVRVSKALIDTLHEHTDATVAEMGWDEFVEAALRRSLIEGWNDRHDKQVLPSPFGITPEQRAGLNRAVEWLIKHGDLTE
jgi:hypothetical protein